jgi:hypothetical protein
MPTGGSLPMALLFFNAYRRLPMRQALHFFLRERNEAKKAPG